MRFMFLIVIIFSILPSTSHAFKWSKCKNVYKSWGVTENKSINIGNVILDWFELLDRFRTGSVTYRDKIIKLNKFSSMGNSYTFELESLIFYSLAVATCSHLGIDPRDVSVYGDDVIIPANAVTLFYVIRFCRRFTK